MSLQIRACGLSDVGRSRSHNEDCFGIDSDRGVYVVADGMGGHGHGEVASRIAVETIRQALSQPGSLAGGQGETVELKRHSQLLKAAVGRAHKKVVQAVQQDSALAGMGTTVVSFMLEEAVGAIAHVGDSRAYRFRGGVLELITEDHTWVNEQVVAGYLSEDQARAHPLKSVVTRAIGGDGEIEVDVREIDVRSGDLFLLCSDGLTTMLSDEEIHSNLNLEEPLERLCTKLVEAANVRGGLDNVTVVLLAVVEDPEGTAEPDEDDTTTVLPREALTRDSD